MLDLLSRSRTSTLIGSALAFAAVLGWGGFAYSAFSSQWRISAITSERDTALAERDRLQGATGDLAQVEGRLASARVEYSRVVQGWAEAKARTAVAQQELATLNKRLDQTKDRVAQTGSIRQTDPLPRQTRKQ